MPNKPKMKSVEKWYWILFLKTLCVLSFKPKKTLKYIDYKTNFRIYYLFQLSEFDKLDKDFISFKAKGNPIKGTYRCYTLIGEPMHLDLKFSEIYDI